MQLACAILLSVACPAIQYLSTLPHERYDLHGSGVGGEILCFDFLYSV
jgi:hypothetical protein